MVRSELSSIAHESRELARLAVWRQVEKDRCRGGELLEISKGIDKELTTRLLNKSHSRDQGILRKIIACAVWCQTKRSHLPRNNGARMCEHCDEGVEDLRHLFWGCPAWENVRAKYCEDMEYILSTPNSLLCYVIVSRVITVSPKTVVSIQKCLIAVCSERFRGTAVWVPPVDTTT